MPESPVAGGVAPCGTTDGAGAGGLPDGGTADDDGAGGGGATVAGGAVVPMVGTDPVLCPPALPTGVAVTGGRGTGWAFGWVVSAGVVLPVTGVATGGAAVPVPPPVLVVEVVPDTAPPDDPEEPCDDPWEE